MTTHHHHSSHGSVNLVRVIGPPISVYSKALLKTLARQAHLHTVHVTSVQRAVSDQARIFFHKHVVEGKKASYKNAEVGKIIAHARKLHEKGSKDDDVIAYLIGAIEGVHGGPQSVSRHLGGSPFLEVFDVAHYSGPTSGAKRHNYMNATQAEAFLEACRRYMSAPITRLGHSAELTFVRPEEFKDEKCFHFEVAQPVLDRLTVPNTMIA
jgi:hypothetical protein